MPGRDIITVGASAGGVEAPIGLIARRPSEQAREARHRSPAVRQVLMSEPATDVDGADPEPSDAGRWGPDG